MGLMDELRRRALLGEARQLYAPVQKKENWRDRWTTNPFQFEHPPMDIPVHTGRRGEVFEEAVKGMLHTAGLSRHFGENKQGGAFWDVFFHNQPFWHPFVRGKYTNIKNKKTPWVSHIGLLEHQLPWGKPSAFPDSTFIEIIRGWVYNNLTHLVLMKPILDEAVEEVLTAWNSGNLSYIYRILKSNYWLYAQLGPQFDVEIYRNDDGSMNRFNILKGYPVHRPPAFYGRQFRMPGYVEPKYKFSESKYAPIREFLPRYSFLRNQEAWEQEDMNEVNGSVPIFVKSIVLDKGDHGLVTGSDSVYHHPTYLVEPSFRERDLPRKLSM